MGAPQTWILTGSPENLAATRERQFALIGLKEGRRRQAEQIAPGDRIVLEHIRGWPAQHWKLAFQGQIRAVSGADAAVLVDRLRAVDRVRA